MDAGSPPQRWEVAVGPLDDPRFFQVPDAGLQEFLRTLASQGVSEFEISSAGWVFRISRLAMPLRQPEPEEDPDPPDAMPLGGDSPLPGSHFGA